MEGVYSEAFWISIAGLLFGFLGLTIRVCLKSKCDRVDCCCLKIHRAVDLEEKFEEKELEMGVENKV